MDFRVLFASFALVFLAELGDKTQLTALAFTTSTRSPWTVFLGTSLALICTTALAVVLGEALARIVPERYLHIGSAVMFVLVGLVLLVNVARKSEAPPAPMPAVAPGTEQAALPATGGALFALIVRQAATIEEDIIDQLDEIRARLPEGRERAVLAGVIDEDRRHLRTLLGLPGEHAADFDQGDGRIAAGEFAELCGRTPLFAEPPQPLAPPSTEVAEQLRRAVALEESIADAYLAFARLAKVHAVKDAFRWLAMEDIRHAQILCDLVNPPAAPNPAANLGGQMS